MVELTQEQKAMLNLSKEKINDLATANPLARKASMNKIMKPFEEKLRDAARAIDESEKRDKALEDIPPWVITSSDSPFAAPEVDIPMKELPILDPPFGTTALAAVLEPEVL